MTAVNRQEADQEPDNVRLFPQAGPANYPKRSYAIDVTSPAGFPITITYNDMTLDRLDEALAALFERGYTPAEPLPNAPAAAPVPVAQPGQPPICVYHGPMKESDKRPGTWYCPKKLADGSGYCKEKFPKT